ncbi:LuxR C-terminal-related transcriptional regulator [Kitasatospora viridis]|uniref:LuxR C-terminal-related transcriptional regulator n=1 Tax=Kitasatospora viridis TaxID=281105 RepID=UPI0014788805|nr:LuxR C-terminal-related transcriptional regulator [Kitasatospora viridis]
MALGLTPPLPDAPDYVYALSPGTAAGFAVGRMEERVAEYQAAIRSTQAAFSALESIHAESSMRDGAGYSLIRGSETISEVLSTSVAACRSELLTTQPGASRPAELLARALESEIPRLRQGIRQRTIYQHKIRFDAPTMDYINLITAVGAQVRTTSELFDRLIIIDRETAFIPVDDEREVTALQIHHPGIVRYLGKIFDHIWERAIDVGTASARHAPQISDTQRAILHHLVSGQTDEWIARRVGLSRRSIAEHVRRISEQLGSSSRAQLGYLIALNGVLWGAEGATNPQPTAPAPDQDQDQ